MLYKLLLLLLLGPVSAQALEMALGIGLQIYKVVQTAKTIEQIFATEADQLLERFVLPNALSNKEIIQNQLMLNYLNVDDPS